MKLEKLVGERFKERPSDSVVESHALMARGGYIKNVANGIFSQYTPMKRISKKIEEIIRKEMDAIDGQEVLFPVVLPASLWEESGRYQSIGSELLRFKDRSQSPLVLGMTHEEAAVHLVREYGQSYQRYPFMIYQIQTKFRDEARPRGGLIRVREFTMKDAYSFHTSNEDLEQYYDRCHKAYENIFRKAGIPEVISVASDSGMMGGKVSHEFMLLTAIGEDSLAICSACDYKANMEAASCKVENEQRASKALTKVHTPNHKTMEEVCNFLQVDLVHTIKAVVYQKNMTDDLVVVFLRGDLEANETKIRNFLKEDIHPAVEIDGTLLVPGFIGPMNLSEKITILFDESIKDTKDMVVGANEADYHMTGFEIARDVAEVSFGDFAKIQDGGICPSCGGKTIAIERGIEVGNIFQLGDKYTDSMDMKYTDQEGNLQTPIMGCYGIGVGRLAASVCEVRRDEYGPIWPISIAPWQVHLCCLRADDARAKEYADGLYEALQAKGIEVIYDDRIVRPGVMFSDADLLGVPVRVVVSPRNLDEECCEIKTRDKKVDEKVPMNDTLHYIVSLVDRLQKELQ